MSLRDVSPVNDLSPAHAVSVVTTSALDGRRRPGRPAQVSPSLVPLLRSAPYVEVPTSLSGVEIKLLNEDLSMARGFGVGMLLAIPIWSAIGLVAWALLR